MTAYFEHKLSPVILKAEIEYRIQLQGKDYFVVGLDGYLKKYEIETDMSLVSIDSKTISKNLDFIVDSEKGYCVGLTKNTKKLIIMKINLNEKIVSPKYVDLKFEDGKTLDELITMLLYDKRGFLL